MAFIDWNAKLSVSVPEFDEEHKEVIEMINSLHGAMKSGKGKDLVAKILDEVSQYAVKHFSHEEKLMVQYQYPQFREHKAAHDEFIKKSTEFKEQYEEQRLPPTQLLLALQDWWINHINIVDKNYGPFFTAAMKK